MTDPNDTPRKPIFATDEQAPEPLNADVENAEVEKEHDAAWDYATEHDEPIGG